MSKGPWTTESRTKQYAEIMRLRQARAEEREATNDRVIAILDERGPLSIEQICNETGLAKSTVQYAIDRLRRGGEVCKLPAKHRIGKFGNPACLYALGVEDDMKRKPETVIVRRHPQDVALYGEYQREAA